MSGHTLKSFQNNAGLFLGIYHWTYVFVSNDLLDISSLQDMLMAQLFTIVFAGPIGFTK